MPPPPPSKGMIDVKHLLSVARELRSWTEPNVPADAAEARLAQFLRSSSTHDCVTGDRKPCQTFSLDYLEGMIQTVSRSKTSGFNLYSLSAQSVADNVTLSLLTDSLLSLAQTLGIVEGPIEEETPSEARGFTSKLSKHRSPPRKEKMQRKRRNSLPASPSPAKLGGKRMARRPHRPAAPLMGKPPAGGRPTGVARPYINGKRLSGGRGSSKVNNPFCVDEFESNKSNSKRSSLPDNAGDELDAKKKKLFGASGDLSDILGLNGPSKFNMVSKLTQKLTAKPSVARYASDVENDEESDSDSDTDSSDDSHGEGANVDDEDIFGDAQSSGNLGGFGRMDLTRVVREVRRKASSTGANEAEVIETALRLLKRSGFKPLCAPGLMSIVASKVLIMKEQLEEQEQKAEARADSLKTRILGLKKQVDEAQENEGVANEKFEAMKEERDQLQFKLNQVEKSGGESSAAEAKWLAKEAKMKEVFTKMETTLKERTLLLQRLKTRLQKDKESKTGEDVKLKEQAATKMKEMERKMTEAVAKAKQAQKAAESCSKCNGAEQERKALEELNGQLLTEVAILKQQQAATHSGLGSEQQMLRAQQRKLREQQEAARTQLEKQQKEQVKQLEVEQQHIRQAKQALRQEQEQLAKSKDAGLVEESQLREAKQNLRKEQEDLQALKNQGLEEQNQLRAQQVEELAAVRILKQQQRHEIEKQKVKHEEELDLHRKQQEAEVNRLREQKQKFRAEQQKWESKVSKLAADSKNSTHTEQQKLREAQKKLRAAQEEARPANPEEKKREEELEDLLLETHRQLTDREQDLMVMREEAKTLRNLIRARSDLNDQLKAKLETKEDFISQHMQQAIEGEDELRMANHRAHQALVTSNNENMDLRGELAKRIDSIEMLESHLARAMQEQVRLMQENEQQQKKWKKWGGGAAAAVNQLSSEAQDAADMAAFAEEECMELREKLFYLRGELQEERQKREEEQGAHKILAKEAEAHQNRAMKLVEQISEFEEVVFTQEQHMRRLEQHIRAHQEMQARIKQQQQEALHLEQQKQRKQKQEKRQMEEQDFTNQKEERERKRHEAHAEQQRMRQQKQKERKEMESAAGNMQQWMVDQGLAVDKEGEEEEKKNAEEAKKALHEQQQAIRMQQRQLREQQEKAKSELEEQQKQQLEVLHERQQMLREAKQKLRKEQEATARMKESGRAEQSQLRLQQSEELKASRQAKQSQRAEIEEQRRQLEVEKREMRNQQEEELKAVRELKQEQRKKRQDLEMQQDQELKQQTEMLQEEVKRLREQKQKFRKEQEDWELRKDEHLKAQREMSHAEQQKIREQKKQLRKEQDQMRDNRLKSEAEAEQTEEMSKEEFSYVVRKIARARSLMEMSPELGAIPDELHKSLGPAGPHLSELIWDYEERIDRLVTAMKYTSSDDFVFAKADNDEEGQTDERMLADLKYCAVSPVAASSTNYTSGYFKGKYVKPAQVISDFRANMPSEQDMSDYDNSDNECDETVIADEVHAAAQDAISTAFSLVRPKNKLSKKDEFNFVDRTSSKASFSQKQIRQNDENLDYSYGETSQKNKEADYLGRKKGDKPKEHPLADSTNKHRSKLS